MLRKKNYAAFIVVFTLFYLLHLLCFCVYFLMSGTMICLIQRRWKLFSSISLFHHSGWRGKNSKAIIKVVKKAKNGCGEKAGIVWRTYALPSNRGRVSDFWGSNPAAVHEGAGLFADSKIPEASVDDRNGFGFVFSESDY